jgi:hypothetical protein
LKAEILQDNHSALYLFKKMNFEVERGFGEGILTLNLAFKDTQ